MLAHPFTSAVWVSIALAGFAHAHQVAWHPAMYCLNGTAPFTDPLDNGVPAEPLYQLPYSKFWVHNSDGCNDFPPEDGVFMELPAGGEITLQIAENRRFTTLDGSSSTLTEWGDGQEHPENYSMTNLGGLKPSDSGCIPAPNLHTQNESMAAGTAIGISYNSRIEDVTPENVVVFTVLKNTPWKRLATYRIPSGMPPCPPGGCTCIWGWIANNCGQRNMNIYPYKCNVIPDSTPVKTIGTPKPAVWCEGDPSKCVKGPKQPLIYDQLERNNIEVEGFDLSGEIKTPGYNSKCGFSDGAQYDIFVETSTPAGSNTSASPSTTPALSFTTPTPSLPAGSDTPALPSLTPASSLPAGYGTPTYPNPPTDSPGACKRSTEDSTGAGYATHSKRMKMHRERKFIF